MTCTCNQAFCNNIVGMVKYNAKEETESMVFNILFHDPSAEYEEGAEGRRKRVQSEEKEKKAHELFRKLMRMHILREHGFYRTIVACWELDAKTWQTLMIKDKKNEPDRCQNPECKYYINTSKMPREGPDSPAPLRPRSWSSHVGEGGDDSAEVAP